jgi:hypothetical protein
MHRISEVEPPHLEPLNFTNENHPDEVVRGFLANGQVWSEMGVKPSFELDLSKFTHWRWADE